MIYGVDDGGPTKGMFAYFDASAALAFLAQMAEVSPAADAS
jgi:hypothetical protein